MKERKIVLNGAEFVLGKKYKDMVLGVEGVAISGASYLTGCDQINLTFTDSTGRPCEQWVHVTDIVGVDVEDENGGPRPCMINGRK